MKKFTALLMAVALVAVGAIFVIGQTGTDGPTDDKPRMGKHAKHGKFGRRGKRGGHAGRLFRQLDLTDAQKEQLKTLRQTHRESTQTLREQMRLNREQLRNLSDNGGFDEAAVTALATQQGQLHAQMIVARERLKAQMFNVLTPEQKVKAAELKAQFEQKREERKARWAEMKNREQSQ